MNPVTRLLILPTQWESRAVLKSLPCTEPEPGWDVPAWRAGNWLVLESGLGPARVAALLPRLQSLVPCEIWLYGWCGGLHPDLRPGDLVLADATFFDPHGPAPQEPIAHPPPEFFQEQLAALAEEMGLRLVVGPILTAARVFAGPEQKRAGATTGAVAVEMEAGPLAAWTSRQELPFIHLRVVLDPLDSTLPRWITGGQGSSALPARLLDLLLHPRRWVVLWRLLGQARRASWVMGDVIAGLVNGF